MSKHADRTVHLGYEVDTGKPVSIPVRNMAITGQTQEAGKTTALEALITRANLPAVAFITKRGERSFSDGRRIRPYFREQADWQFVLAVLEATMRQRLNIHRSFIMKVCHNTKRLADVQHNVRLALPKARGLAEGIYTELDAYLELVVPQISRQQWATGVDIQPGLNIMDLGGYSSEMQALVIRSVIEWIYQKETGVITIIPEAWEFLPQGRSGPVKLAAEALLRKGSALKNYVWVDSQDMAGVDKVTLKGCPVWLIGVQREANETKRALANIPAGVGKPKVEQIMTLGIGQFYVCHGRSVQRVYVQPAWMDADEAIAVAKRPDRLSMIIPYIANGLPPLPGESFVTESEAQALRDENQQLRDRIEQLESRLNPPDPEPAESIPLPKERKPTYTATNGGRDEDTLVERLVARVLNHPSVVKLRHAKSTISMEVTTPKIEMDSKSLKGRIAILIHKQFFKGVCKRHSDVKAELERTGASVNGGNLSTAMADFVKLGFLTDEGTAGFMGVSDMVVNVVKK